MTRRAERLPRPIAALLTTYRRTQAHGVVGRAAEVGFFSLLALPPTLLAVLGGIGYMAGALGPEATNRIRERVFSFAGIFLTPRTIRDLLQPAVDSLLIEGRADIIGIGVVITLWSASRATKVLMEGVRNAYGVEDTRRPVKKRLIAIAVTLVGMVAAILVLPLLVAGPRLGAAIGSPFGLADEFRTAWRVLYWPVAGLVGIALLTSFYDVAIPVKRRWMQDLPGAAVAVGVWLLAGAGLRLYASLVLGADSAYGPLSAPVVLLIWLYVTALAVILGAETNAGLERVRSRADEELPNRDITAAVAAQGELRKERV